MRSYVVWTPLSIFFLHRVNKNKWQVQTKCIPAYSDCSNHSINNNVFKKESGITLIIIIIKKKHYIFLSGSFGRHCRVNPEVFLLHFLRSKLWHFQKQFCTCNNWSNRVSLFSTMTRLSDFESEILFFKAYSQLLHEFSDNFET